MPGTILLIIVIIMLVGSLPTWRYNQIWDYGPSGLLGTVLILLSILFLLGHIKSSLIYRKTGALVLQNIKMQGLALLVLFSLISCDRPEVIKDLSDTSFSLVNQDSTSVTFPQDWEGKVLVVEFIYTNCPDVCPAITANMKNVSQQLENPSDVQFVGITFDPERDTPSVLKKYMQQFKLDEEQFTFLTGDTTTVDSLLSTLDIVAEVSSTKTTSEGEKLYFMRHTNRISLLDQQGRLRLEYSGSYSKPEHIVEGINKLR